MTEKTTEKESALLKWMVENGPVAVAFSGGVDSTLLATAAMKAVSLGGETPVAILAVSPTSSEEDLLTARRVAAEIGVRLIEIPSSEMVSPDFLQNAPDRCYHCKRIRFSEMKRMVDQWNADSSPSSGTGPERTNHRNWILADGENADDLSAYRPGGRAAKELGVRSPLAELGIDKGMIRRIARKWGLSVAERPSTPCLVTRLAYGLSPDPVTLRQIEAAEAHLKEEGFPICRVRIDSPSIARIEIPASEIPRITASPLRERIFSHLNQLGFSLVTVDLEGFASGKMDRFLDLKKDEDR